MKVGTEEILIHPESKRALDVEIVLLTALTYVVIFLYAQDYFSWPLFYLLFHLFYMRFFMGNHDRFHVDLSRRWPRPLEWFAENFAVVVTPWDEPYDSIKKKHFTHHLTHFPEQEPETDFDKDPHSIYESGGMWRSLFYCFFFEEAQLFYDIRHRNIGWERVIRLVIYLPLIIWFIATFGWAKYGGVFMAVRLMSASGWFFFSWFSHVYFYRFGSRREIPRFVLFLLYAMNGRRVGNGFFRHTAHHVWPSVPSGQLYKMDEAVMRHPEARPVMIPSS